MEEKGSILSANEHSSPFQEMECMCCFDDITESCYVEYQVESDEQWLPSLFCQSCIEHLLDTQWQRYIDLLANATCKAEMRRLLEDGPPIYINDRKALPCPDGTYVSKLWFASDKSIRSAKLKNSLVGDERENWIAEKEAFKFEGDDDY